MRHFLDFEKPIAALEGKIEELRHLGGDSGVNIAEEIGKLQSRIDTELASIPAIRAIFFNNRLKDWRFISLSRPDNS